MCQMVCNPFHTVIEHSQRTPRLQWHTVRMDRGRQRVKARLIGCEEFQKVDNANSCRKKTEY